MPKYTKKFKIKFIQMKKVQLNFKTLNKNRNQIDLDLQLEFEISIILQIIFCLKFHTKKTN